MLKKVALIGVTAAAILGTGGAALAATGSTPTPSTSAAPAPAATGTTGAKAKATDRRGADFQRLRNVDHASWVTGRNGTFVTHQFVRGTVSAVSATAITVASADKTVTTYTVNPATKVHTRAKHKDAAIADVKVGDPISVTGTGAQNPTATQIVDTKK